MANGGFSVDGFLGGIGDFIGGAISGTVDVVGDVVGGIAGSIGDIVSSVGDIGGTVTESAKTMPLFSGLQGVVTGTADFFGDTLKAIGGKLGIGEEAEKRVINLDEEVRGLGVDPSSDVGQQIKVELGVDRLKNGVSSGQKSLIDPSTWDIGDIATLAGLYLMYTGQRDSEKQRQQERSEDLALTKEKMQMELELQREKLDIQRQGLIIDQQRVDQQKGGPAVSRAATNVFV